MLTDDEVRHIAKLARLGLKDTEIHKFAIQLSDILGYVQKLDEVDTSQVLPTAQVTGLHNVMREDKEERFCMKDELLACTELPLLQGQIKVQPVMNS